MTLLDICAIIWIFGCPAQEVSREPVKQLEYAAYKKIKVPSKAWQYQRQIIKASWTYHNTDKYVSATAAQIHQESYWNTNAKSWVGAAGLTQFMPATARGESKRCGLGIPAVYDPWWSIQANGCYMAYLVKRNHEFVPGCEQYAAGLSAYNGGQGNVNKQRRKWAQYTHSDPNKNVVWFDGVVDYKVRGKSAHKENSHYPGRTLIELTPNYIAAGYGGEDICKAQREIEV